MEKKKQSKGSLLLWGAVILICEMIFLGVSFYLIECCRITDQDQHQEMMIDLMEENKASFRESDNFRSRFLGDAETIARNLTVLGQFETNNQYDAEKKIDIISYYYRKNPNLIPDQYKDLQIEYKLKDLLAWEQVCTVEMNEKDWMKAHPAFQNDAADSNSEAVSVEIEYDDAAYEDYEGEIPVPEIEEKYYSSITEEYLPCDGISLYEREYATGAEVFEESRRDDMGRTPSLRLILESTVNELHSNYEIYQSYETLLKASQNLKYVLLDTDGRIIKSNLHLKPYVMKMERAKRTEALTEAFGSRQTNLTYTYGENTCEVNNLDIDAKREFGNYMKFYDYAYPSGVRLMVCVLDPSENHELLGNYVRTDLYGQADVRYTQVSGMLQGYLFALGACLLIAAIAFILFTIFVPKMERDEVSGFHKVPTLLAAVIMIVIGASVACPPFIMIENFGNRNLPGGEYAAVFKPVTVCCAFLAMTIFLYAWYSLILRIKSRTVLYNSLTAVLILRKDSIVRRFFRFLGQCMHAIADFFTGQQTVLLKTVFPYLLFLMVNFVILAASRMSVFGVFLCLVIDGVVGAVLYYLEQSRMKVAEGVQRIIEGDVNYQIDTSKMYAGTKKTAEQVNQIQDTIKSAVEKSMADERMKTELITNVSHDIKTPLTSVINYVDLLKREDIPGERAQEYIRILEEKSQRLKVLIFDLVEASKISSGNITLQNTACDMCELISQALGEFEDRFQESELSVICEKPEEKMMVWADPARLWRVLENLLGNVSKYAMPGSRVYVDLEKKQTTIRPGEEKTMIDLTIKNMSKNPLNISAQELTERFVRGDEARTSEGSGLGLSIARDLTELMNGTLSIHLDGDLFKVTVQMPEHAADKEQDQEKAESF